MHIYAFKISTFGITFIGTDPPSDDVIRFIFTRVFIIFPNLRCLQFHPYSDKFAIFIHDLPQTIISSTLFELHVCVRSFSDCLYLLDGRFDQLRAFYVTTSMVIRDHPLPTVDKVD